MTSTPNPDSNSSPKDLYSFLGLKPGASFDEVQRAKEKAIADAGDDSIAKAKIESCYDSLLMVSLKERQLGKVSNEAASASALEAKNNDLLVKGKNQIAGLLQKSSLLNNSSGANNSDQN